MQISADEQLIRQEVETNTVLATSLVGVERKNLEEA